jgi:hypothetical protein
VIDFLINVGTLGCGTLLFVVGVVWLVAAVRQRAAEQRFLRQYDSRTIFVATRRGGWYDFLRNNVLPLLSADVEVVWFEDKTSTPIQRVLYRLVRRASRVTPSKPYFVRIAAGKAAVIEAHEQLRPFQASAARDAGVQEQIARLLESWRVR